MSDPLDELAARGETICSRYRQRAEAAEARCAELEGEWDVGFTEGLRAMRERAAAYIEKYVPTPEAKILAASIRALPLEDKP